MQLRQKGISMFAWLLSKFFTRRTGHTYRIYDSIALVGGCKSRAVVVLDPESRGGCYSPRATLLLSHVSRTKLNCTGGPLVVTRRISFAIPHMTFNRAYKLRRFGALRYYRIESRTYYKLFRAPRIAT